ncbi:MAG: hypothetical protein ACYSR6_11925 [Planctomycetota bacterium]|jgi:hypothetical protein
MPIDDIEYATEYRDPPEIVINYDGFFGYVFEDIFGVASDPDRQKENDDG